MNKNFICKIGFHKWNNCSCTICGKIRNTNHIFIYGNCLICGLSFNKTKNSYHQHFMNDCICIICGEVINDNYHDWIGCKCRICGEVRNTNHIWEGCQCIICDRTNENAHIWDGCKCTICGEIRDEDHKWNGCTCIICNEHRDQNHNLERCICTICGKEMHNWKIISDITQTKYKKTGSSGGGCSYDREYYGEEWDEQETVKQCLNCDKIETNNYQIGEVRYWRE